MEEVGEAVSLITSFVRTVTQSRSRFTCTTRPDLSFVRRTLNPPLLLTQKTTSRVYTQRTHFTALNVRERLISKQTAGTSATFSLP